MWADRRLERTTSESSVLVEIDLDGTGVSDISTSVPFYDHMLTALSKHSLIDMTVKATGDTHIDVHHTVEDVAITFGEVLKTALGTKAGIRRFGEATVPLDEALAHAVVDVSGRPYLVHAGEPAGQEYHLIGGHFTGSLTRHVFEAITLHAGICLHMNVTAGRDPHHIVRPSSRRVRPGAPCRRRAGPPRRGHSLHQGRTVTGKVLRDGAIIDPEAGRKPASPEGKPTVTVLDYGSGNVRSAVRALERAGAEVILSSKPEDVLNADGLVVPGVGAFETVMNELKAVDAIRMIGRRVAGGRPVLAICVGLQVLFEAGVEHGTVAEGMGEWPGKVELLPADVVPHMGWNTVDVPEGSLLFDGVEKERFYFVHSYGVQHWDFDVIQPRMAAPLVTWSEHGAPFIAAVENGPLCATQFHPEKSGDAGARLLRNWVGSLRPARNAGTGTTAEAPATPEATA